MSLEPLIKASGSSGNLHGMLSYLEEADEGFDFYPMVAWVRNRLKEAVGAMVEEEVGLQCQVINGIRNSIASIKNISKHLKGFHQ